MSSENIKYSALVYPNIRFFPAKNSFIGIDANAAISTQSVGEIYKDSHWGSWLGSVAWDEFSKASVQVLFWVPTKNPEVLDGENVSLEKKAYRFSKALMLSDILLPPSGSPWILSGSAKFVDGKVKPTGIRSLGKGPKWLEQSYVHLNEYHQSARWQETVAANYQYSEEFFKHWTKIAHDIEKAELNFDQNYLLNMSIYAFQHALSDIYLDFSFPNLVRAIETLVALSERQGRSFFARRASPFLPPLKNLCLAYDEKSVKRILKESYGLRSDAVHGKPFGFGMGSSRETFLKEKSPYYVYLIETLARHTIRAFLENEELQKAARDRNALEQYWNRRDPPPAYKTCPTCNQIVPGQT